MTANALTKRNLKGLHLYFPGSPEYELSVATANLEYQYETPLFVAHVTQTRHVTAVAELARTLGKKLTIKGGGHSFAGFSNSPDGILLDMSWMRKVELQISKDATDPGGIVTLQAGALWGHAYRVLVDKQINHYTIMGGRCPDVGVGGFTMGGGLCIFTRSYGMGIDQLKEATMVTINGEGGIEVHTITENASDSKKRDLFWAIRGCGGGNYGVLIEMKMKVHKLFDEEGKVTSGQLVLRSQGSDETAVRKLIDSVKPLHTASWPDPLTMDSFWIFDTSAQSSFTITLPIYHNGNKADFSDTVKSRISEPLATQLCDATIEEPYTLFLHETLQDQFRDDQLRFNPLNKTYNLNSSFVFDNKETTINQLAETMSSLINEFRAQFLGSKSVLELKLIHGGGKASRVETDATAFPWREGVYFGHIMVQWTDKWLGQKMREFFEQSRKRLRSHSLEQRAAFINFTDRTLEDWEYAYYKGNYQKLQKIKAEWDPLDNFRFAQSIRLPQSRSESSLPTQEEGFNQSLEDRWERYVQPDIGFDELVKGAVHSCPSCSTK